VTISSGTGRRARCRRHTHSLPYLINVNAGEPSSAPRQRKSEEGRRNEAKGVALYAGMRISKVGLLMILLACAACSARDPACDSAWKKDRVLERAPAGGQNEVVDLTPLVGLLKDRSHGQASFP
jgi:hypothetical protein